MTNVRILSQLVGRQEMSFFQNSYIESVPVQFKCHNFSFVFVLIFQLHGFTLCSFSFRYIFFYELMRGAYWNCLDFDYGFLNSLLAILFICAELLIY